MDGSKVGGVSIHTPSSIYTIHPSIWRVCAKVRGNSSSLFYYPPGELGMHKESLQTLNLVADGATHAANLILREKESRREFFTTHRDHFRLDESIKQSIRSTRSSRPTWNPSTQIRVLIDLLSSLAQRVMRGS